MTTRSRRFVVVSFKLAEIQVYKSWKRKSIRFNKTKETNGIGLKLYFVEHVDIFYWNFIKIQSAGKTETPFVGKNVIILGKYILLLKRKIPCISV